MKTFGKPLLVLLAIAIFCTAALQGDAQEKKKKDGKKGRKGPDPITKMLEGIDLTTEQRAKIEDVKKEHAPKLAAIEKRRDEIMTPDRRRAERQAKKAAKDAGKKGKEAKADVEAALGLSPAERDKMASIQKDEQELRAKMREQVRALLTADQRAKLPEPAKKKRKA